MLGRPNDRMLKAFTGLEGGLVASGSSCGVVTAGAVSLALMHLEALAENRAVAESGVMSLARDYTRWFGRQYGSCLCRERTGVNFYTPYGQARYFFPGDKAAKCLWHIRGAALHVQALVDRPLPAGDELPPAGADDTPHCAGTVLQKIRERTGLGDDMLDKVAFVLDGGVGLSGGVCGALTGAVLGINLLLGMDVRDMSYLQTIRAFITGHLNLLFDKPPETGEPFYAGKTVVRRFMEEAGNIECASITGRTFSSCPEFREYIGAAAGCRRLMDRAADFAVEAIEKWR